MQAVTIEPFNARDSWGYLVIFDVVDLRFKGCQFSDILQTWEFNLLLSGWCRAIVHLDIAATMAVLSQVGIPTLKETLSALWLVLKEDQIP